MNLLQAKLQIEFSNWLNMPNNQPTWQYSDHLGVFPRFLINPINIKDPSVAVRYSDLQYRQLVNISLGFQLSKNYITYVSLEKGKCEFEPRQIRLQHPLYVALTKYHSWVNTQTIIQDYIRANYGQTK